MIVELAGQSARSGGADLHGGAESHEPSATREDGFEPGAKGVAGGAVDFLETLVHFEAGPSIDFLKAFVQLERLDAEPLVSAGYVGTELTARLRIRGFVEPALGKDT